MLLLGIDLGSSSVKVSVVDGESGACLATAFHPADEMKINAGKPGWAEQDPEMWWTNLKASIADCNVQLGDSRHLIGAVGISYQMHGLVVVDRDFRPLRPSIIWCDGRAVEYGEKAFNALGRDFCLSRLLNSPGNFTAAKLAWVKENEPDIYKKIYKILLPGDYISLRMTGMPLTTYSGLSEGIFWDFVRNGISEELMDFFGFDHSLLAEPVNSFSHQGDIMDNIADELGIPRGIPVSYRAGDQPNNAFSLNVLQPGEVAATAGTSGVIYGVTDQRKYDQHSRVNTFLHVNHSEILPRAGVLLCINGTGILNSWLRKNTGNVLSYNEMNRMAAGINPGSDGLTIVPFGNGAERILENRNPGAGIQGLNFNTHSSAHLFRAAQEGIVFSIKYGLDIMKESGMIPSVIRAGSANMFLSPVFREALSCITGTRIDLYNTDGSVGAARGAGIGCGYYKSEKEAFSGLKTVGSVEPDRSKEEDYVKAYNNWLRHLDKISG
ncbi:MAG TPA: FGGY family carbohydrate kinase [Bacteroidales bacterium]|nr:FGGY family carbohydrate kinase [Bacteroidales bacterium]HPF02391.1 FGGY family carbohydrate kinase [Bacteroidales bacterium]HPJ58926.1 FGGY family carbohydrate kinase [Bacteroidales bacterium]HPR12180.1 FGGY family carbohydrate kinase [Bacteroidales bacterium]HRW84863.1 FGGY family carbohydrate kinase [Bacteroidales bacterium]